MFKKSARTVVRQKNGQALAESAVALMVIVPILVCTVLLLINVGYYFYYKSKLDFVAQEVSSYIQGQQYYVGCLRPHVNPDNYDQQKAQALAVANGLLQTMGLPELTDQDLVLKPAHFAGPSGTIHICEVTVCEPRIKLPAGTMFSFLHPQGEGASVAAQGDCFAYVTFRVNDTRNGTNRGFVLPAIGITPLNASFDSRSNFQCAPTGPSLNTGIYLSGQIVGSLDKNEPDGNIGGRIAP